MNLRIGKIGRYNNKILIASPSFKIGTNLKINLLSSENRRLNDDGERVNIKVEPEVKSKEVQMVKSEPDVKPKVKNKPNIEPNKNMNKMLNLTSSSMEEANLIQVRSLMRKKR